MRSERDRKKVTRRHKDSGQSLHSSAVFSFRGCSRPNQRQRERRREQPGRHRLSRSVVPMWGRVRRRNYPGQPLGIHRRRPFQAWTLHHPAAGCSGGSYQGDIGTARHACWGLGLLNFRSPGSLEGGSVSCSGRKNRRLILISGFYLLQTHSE